MNLEDCDEASWEGAKKLAKKHGLIPGKAGQCFFLPTNGFVQYLIGYKGLVDIAYRCPRVKSINAQVVYEHDEFEVDASENHVHHLPHVGTNRGDPTDWWALIELDTGGTVLSYMDVERVLERKKFSMCSKVWDTWFAEMGLKCVVKQACNLLPLEFDLRNIVAEDQVIIKDGKTVSIFDFAFKVEENLLTAGKHIL